MRKHERSVARGLLGLVALSMIAGLVALATGVAG